MTTTGHKYVYIVNGDIYLVTCNNCGQEMELFGSALVLSEECPSCGGNKFRAQRFMSSNVKGISVVLMMMCKFGK